MRKLGFDPSAEVHIAGHDFRLAETTLERNADGGLALRVFQDDDGVEIVTVVLRPDFLDEFLAQARARQADAA